jgi:hypothetical protein
MTKMDSECQLRQKENGISTRTAFSDGPCSIVTLQRILSSVDGWLHMELRRWNIIIIINPLGSESVYT